MKTKVKRIRKLRRKQKYNVNRNRKRLRNKLKKLPVIPCDEVKKAWERKKSMRTNLGDMGLAYDVNEAIQIPNTRHEILEEINRKDTEDENTSDSEDEDVDVNPIKNYVANKLEAEAKAPRQRRFRLPKAQAQFLTYLIKQYGEDYTAMSRDKKNHYQLTWKQIRAKIKQFKGISEQYNEYLEDNSVQVES